MYTLSEIYEFIETESGSKKLTENSDLERDLGISGDDFLEFMQRYATKFKVNIDNYLWYFHHDEEGYPFIGQLLFKSPRQIVNKHIPVTPRLLLEFANTGKWAVDYPNHNLPKKRYDIIANQIFAVIILLAFVLFVIYY